MLVLLETDTLPIPVNCDIDTLPTEIVYMDLGGMERLVRHMLKIC